MPKILVVEDDETNIQILSRLLTMKGYEHVVASNRKDAVRLASEELPDLILMDVNIPGMDGLETTTRFKRDPKLTDIPVIALTANAMKSDRERCLAAGCDGYMQKPVGVSDLRREITRYSSQISKN